MATARMTFRHIEAYRAVMVTGSMTAAASQLHTSQPQVSRLIGQLETLAHFALFERKGSRILPTQDGLRFYKEVEQSFVGLGALEQAAGRIQAFSASRFSVAAMPRLAGGLLARIVADFKTSYPDVLVSIHSGDANAVNNWIGSGFCEAGLAIISGPVPGLEVEPVLTLHCVAVLPRGHRLATKRKLKPSDFAGQAFIDSTSSDGLREQIDSAFLKAGVQRCIVAEASLGSSVCALVGAGVGISIVNPLAAFEEQENAGIEVRPFAPALALKVALLYPSHHKRTRLVKTFAGHASRLMLKEMAGLKAS